MTDEQKAKARRRKAEKQRERMREKYATDPEWVKKNNEKKKQYMRDKRATDPELREKERQYSNNRMRYKRNADPDWLKTENQRKSEYVRRKYATDPEWVEKRRKNKRDRVRQKRATDPTWAKKERQYKNNFRRQRAKTDVQFRLKCIVRAEIWRVLKYRGCVKKNPTFQILGYTPSQLKTHLEFLFTDGMSWENYGKGGWHIDHIRPISSFNFTSETDPEFLECWALSNLQPLWATTRVINGVEYIGNLNKSAKF